MNVFNMAAALLAAEHAGALVVFQNTETGEVFGIDDIEIEHHEDTSAVTCWIKGTPF